MTWLELFAIDAEIFDLELLAANCAADGVHEFMFVAPPLTITGAVGSPINPQAIRWDRGRT
jgi:hypothetical protein